VGIDGRCGVDLRCVLDPGSPLGPDTVSVAVALGREVARWNGNATAQRCVVCASHDQDTVLDTLEEPHLRFIANNPDVWDARGLTWRTGGGRPPPTGKTIGHTRAVGRCYDRFSLTAR
jgi:hypothetical protein